MGRLKESLQKSAKSSVRVCVPFYQDFYTARSGIIELLHFDKETFHVEVRQGTYIYALRNSLINDDKSNELRQLDFGFDRYLFIDSDISFTVDKVLSLLNQDKNIVSGVYRTHNDPSLYQCGEFYPNNPGQIIHRYNAITVGTRKVDWCGAGFLMIKKEVFQNMEYPWFRHHMVKAGTAQREAGEDIGFCINAKKAGYDIWCDFDCEVGHKRRTAESFDWKIE
jgi:hypothetical protein